jgi:Fe-S-cluster formation regulator IscX/YfhJ
MAGLDPAIHASLAKRFVDTVPTQDHHIINMTDTAHPLPELDENEAEAAALKAAIAKSRADPREVPYEEMREWLLQIAAGDFTAKPPTPRLL